MYFLFAAELDEKTGKKTGAYKCSQLGELLYRTRDYEKSIYYTQASIARETDTSFQIKRAVVNRYNTIGLCYQRMNNYDSAFFYFDIGMRMADELHDTVWKAIISGNKGQIYYWQKKYAIAKPLLEFDYNISKNAKEEAN
jgi:tetratricopeptide (TPR) repeat protein